MFEILMLIKYWIIINKLQQEPKKINVMFALVREGMRFLDCTIVEIIIKYM